MTFHIGERVVCVDAEHPNLVGFAELKRGCIYTIRDLAWRQDVGACLLLVEFRRPVFPEGGETPFSVHRFRPLDERRIDQFRAHLAPVDKHLVPA